MSRINQVNAGDRVRVSRFVKCDLLSSREDLEALRGDEFIVQSLDPVSDTCVIDVRGTSAYTGDGNFAVVPVGALSLTGMNGFGHSATVVSVGGADYYIGSGEDESEGGDLD